MNNTDSEYWSLYENGNKLSPLIYSNGKTQESLVKEVSDLIKKGKKVIFIHGVCGTGKSAIALNLGRFFGKASIVVPVKNLQKQYENDYYQKKYLLDKKGNKLKISIITGRENHDSIIIPGVTCADPFLPDTIVITEKNKDKIINYYRENPFIQNKMNPQINKLRRISIAPANPYWSPIRSIDYPFTQLKDARQKIYRGANRKTHIFYHRKEGCSYYDQYQSYIDSDIIIFNAAKYEIEMAIGRKPETAIDIIDEADAFLDNFSKNDNLNLTRFFLSLQTFHPEFEETFRVRDKILELINLEHKNKLATGIMENEIFPLKDTFIGKALRILAKSEALKAEISLDEAHYANKALETALTFEDLFEETFVSYSRDDKELYANLVTINLAKRFSDLCAKTNALVLMSGTIHSDDVLKNIFGINDYAIVKAETKMPGNLEISETGQEIDCKYDNFNSGKHTREQYLKALSASLETAKKPALVHVNAYQDLPSEEEISLLSLNNMLSKDGLRTIQTNDKLGLEIEKFKSKLKDILFSTKCSRGVDFPGDICNSVIFTKYPNPNANDIFWKILRRMHPGYFWSFYKDKARREFLQRIYRALRSQDDHVFVLSPDLRVLEAAKRLNDQDQS
ncbi:hypothetical protein HYW75_01110 [Candidatus Pacearchaeota archaeon]|nr:hypothetical protein [Candidatus Pacearchaeota archaeon]